MSNNNYKITCLSINAYTSVTVCVHSVPVQCYIILHVPVILYVIIMCHVYPERIQLTYGFKNSAGHVEIFYKYHNDYKQVCDTNWDLNDANVICHQLGYPGAIRATTRSYFTYRSDSSTSQQMRAIFNNVDCTGVEKSIFDCQDVFGMPLDIFTLDSCPSQSSAGVICNG